MLKPIRIAVFSAGVELPEVKNAIKILNYKTNNEIVFRLFAIKEIKELVKNCPKELKIIKIPSMSIGGVTCTITENSLLLYENIRKKLEEQYSCKYLLVITPFNLFDDESEAINHIVKFGSDYAGYFVLDNTNSGGNTSIVSVKNLDEFSKKANRELEMSIVFLIISALVMLLTDIDFESNHLDSNGHPTSVGCLNDYCATLDEIVPSLMSLDFCQDCQNELKQEKNGDIILSLAHDKRNLPWHYGQPVSFWSSLILIPIGVTLLAIGNFENEAILNSIGSAATVVGSFLLGVSRIINQKKK